MSKILKESEASKASEASTANNSTQASYASKGSPQISYYIKSASGVLTAAGVFFWKNTPGEKNTHTPAPKFCSRIRAGNSIFPPVTSNLFDP